ncbi:MAG: hypothetical protein BWY09_03035 [Candidatus Hydrogenedentes bacterium ADurb.Bin179]|nr:MAG: hypothetical protein BWY09_03035 [Candidatus Hydrogenedentes bacterium ADurb.Bin179]
MFLQYFPDGGGYFGPFHGNLRKAPGFQITIMVNNIPAHLFTGNQVFYGDFPPLQFIFPQYYSDGYLITVGIAELFGHILFAAKICQGVVSGRTQFRRQFHNLDRRDLAHSSNTYLCGALGARKQVQFTKRHNQAIKTYGSARSGNFLGKETAAQFVVTPASAHRTDGRTSGNFDFKNRAGVIIQSPGQTGIKYRFRFGNALCIQILGKIQHLFQGVFRLGCFRQVSFQRIYNPVPGRRRDAYKGDDIFDEGFGKMHSGNGIAGIIHAAFPEF